MKKQTHIHVYRKGKGSVDICECGRFRHNEKAAPPIVEQPVPPKKIKRDDSFTVFMSPEEIREFKSTWPGSALPETTIWFEFDARNNDLIDSSPGLERANAGAVLALSDNALTKNRG